MGRPEPASRRFRSPRDAAPSPPPFDEPDGWIFTPGDYNFRLIAQRVVIGQPLSAGFSLVLGPADIEFLEQPGPERLLTLPLSE